MEGAFVGNFLGAGVGVRRGARVCKTAGRSNEQWGASPKAGRRTLRMDASEGETSLYPTVGEAAVEEVTKGEDPYRYPKTSAELMSMEERVKNLGRNWVPLFPECQLDKKKLTQAVFLGKEYVVYWTEVAGWTVQEDRCPHRLVNLSRGRMNEKGDLECPYHGWSFDTTGACTRIPQAPEQSLCENVPHLSTYPSKIYAEYLWAWFDLETAALCDTVEITMQEQVFNPNCTHHHFMRYVPMDFATLVENTVDPSHVHFAHHKLQGHRMAAGPIHYSVSELCKAAGFELSAETRMGNGTMTFNAPFDISYLTVPNSGGNNFTLQVYATPVRPGLSAIHFFDATIRYQTPFLNSGTLKALKSWWTSNSPVWERHMFRNRVLDGDTGFLPFQESMLLRSKLESNAGALETFHIAAKADMGVVQFRKWYKKYMNETVPFVLGAKPGSKETAPIGTANGFDDRLLIDRFQQHTIHCKSCLDAYNNFKKASVVLGWVFSLLVVVLAVVSSKFSVATSLPIAALAMLCYAARRFIDVEMVPRFEYQEYDHNAIH